MRGGSGASSTTRCLLDFRYTALPALHAFSWKALSDAFFSLESDGEVHFPPMGETEAPRGSHLPQGGHIQRKPWTGLRWDVFANGRRAGTRLSPPSAPRSPPRGPAAHQ